MAANFQKCSTDNFKKNAANIVGYLRTSRHLDYCMSLSLQLFIRSHFITAEKYLVFCHHFHTQFP